MNSYDLMVGLAYMGRVEKVSSKAILFSVLPWRILSLLGKTKCLTK